MHTLKEGKMAAIRVNCGTVKGKIQETSQSRGFSLPQMRCHFRFPPTYVNLIITDFINQKQ